MSKLITPPPEAIVTEDDKTYTCLASYPLTHGHTVVVWKYPVSDLHLLSSADYQHLMGVVENVRTALLTVLNIEKVYLIYMDEIKHVHWHLVPRYNEQGINVLKHVPEETKDFSFAEPLRLALNDSIAGRK